MQENDQREILRISNMTQTNVSVNSSSPPHDSFSDCSDSRLGLHIFTAFGITKAFLLLPLSLLVLHLGHRRWRRQQRSFASTSHSDIFTYHTAAIELIYALGCATYICGRYTGLSGLMKVGFHVKLIHFPGLISFHVLTCVERYLAVAHPITYMELRQSGGVKIRNISCVCVWLLCFGWSGLMLFLEISVIIHSCVLVLSLIVISFCSLRVLCVLIRPGPGEVGGDRERVDQSKRRALNTVMAITGVLWLWFAGFLVCLAVFSSQMLSVSDACAVLMSANWLSLPSSLVLPLLFLHKAGKLVWCH